MVSVPNLPHRSKKTHTVYGKPTMSTLYSTGFTLATEAKLSLGGAEASSCVTLLLERCGNTVFLSWPTITLDNVSGTNPHCEGTCVYENVIFVPTVSPSKHLIHVTVNNVNQIGVCEISKGVAADDLRIRFYPSVDQTTNWPASPASTISASTLCYKLW